MATKAYYKHEEIGAGKVGFSSKCSAAKARILAQKEAFLGHVTF